MYDNLLYTKSYIILVPNLFRSVLGRLMISFDNEYDAFDAFLSHLTCHVSTFVVADAFDNAFVGLDAELLHFIVMIAIHIWYGKPIQKSELLNDDFTTVHELGINYSDLCEC